MKLSYPNGLKFDNALARNVEDGIERIDGKKASLLIVDGGVGEGKTTLGTEMGMYAAKLMKQEFDIINQVRQGGKDFLKGMDWCVSNNSRVIVYDEAGDFNTRASLTYFNKNINRVFETYRALRILVILCLPSFMDIDNSLMKKKIARGLLHCYDRNPKYGNYKGYSLDAMYYIKMHMGKCVVPDKAYSRVYPNFFGHFLDLDPEDSKLLEKHSIGGKKKIIRDGMLKDQGLVKLSYVAKRTGYSDASLRKYVAANNVKREKYGNTYYYHKSLIEEVVSKVEMRGSLISRNKK